MKMLFILCEGGPDVQFIKRTLIASGEYKNDERKLSEFEQPIKGYFGKSWKNQNWDSIQFGEPQQSMLIPSTSLKSIDNAKLLLLFNVGGANNRDNIIKILKMIYEDFSHPGVIERYGSDLKYAILFFFDADDLGIQGRLDYFINEYKDFFNDTLAGLQVETWKTIRNIPIGLFVFSNEGSDKGTLEDSLIHLFNKHRSKLVNDSYDLLNEHSDHLDTTISQKAKKVKSVLTICGQNDRKNAGSSLAVIIKNYDDLNAYFEFSNPQKVWSRIVKMVNSAFN